jgi:hypothetical protein
MTSDEALREFIRRQRALADDRERSGPNTRWKDGYRSALDAVERVLDAVAPKSVTAGKAGSLSSGERENG